MDQTRRLVLFLVIAAVFLFGWNALVQPPAQQPRPAGADSATAAVGTAPAPGAAASATTPVQRPTAGTEPERLVTVRSPLYEYRFSTRGAALNAATLLRFESYVQKGGSVQLVPRSARDVLAHRVAVGRDTIDFRNVTFAPSTDRIDLRAGDAPKQLRFVSTNAGPRAEITYTFRPDGYLVDVQGRITGVPAGGRLITEMGTGLAPHDAPDHGSARELAFVGWDRDKIRRTPIAKVKMPDTIPGPLVWAGIKDRYFLLAVINAGPSRFSELLLEPATDVKYAVGKDTLRTSRARGRVVQPLPANGTFALQAYLGPQEHDRLAAVGHELEEVNPYGYRWLRPVVRPISAVVLWALKEMHSLGLSYGLVLILFGFIVRLATWPLNARAMRSQMKNMAVQPVLQARIKEIQQKYANDPGRMNQEMMATYSELGVNPFSMVSGCLPMLIPMPVLITLFFVFQGAIEFRGTSFAWLPDLSLRDPLHILPVFLMASMFALQWVSTKMSGMEQNEQTRMMMYTMPLVMGFVFFVMPSGLNLYYASTNVASLPQQILIARERRRATDAQKAEDAAKKAAEARNRKKR
ncbi:membrane protein insertase YidC [Longimicrobium sp.]|uniref:membrane protein insertase YidC n=1 Tax=Longimicrobium sp. TaxID=2029185 RepID=UPI002E33F7F7|nr:membrane protein insertase YidC [Longimicrobium sp.]HEX6042637.1 membrane protein insertase YidC [Longimicrobium sp.]